MTTETIYLDRDNSIDLLLKVDGVVEAITATKVTVTIGSITVDSSVTPAAFDLTGLASGILVLKFGALDLPVTPAAPRTAKVIVYTSAAPNGIFWGTFDVKVVE